jgi:subtilisin family serine protease
MIELRKEPRMKIDRIRVAGAIAAVLALAVCAAPSHAQEIRWRGAVPHEQPVMTARDAANAIAVMIDDRDAQRIVVQFSRPVSPGERSMLHEAGVELLSYLGDNAYFATARRESLDAQRIARFDALQMARPIERLFKMHPLLLEDDPPAWTVAGGAGGAGDGRGRNEPDANQHVNTSTRQQDRSGSTVDDVDVLPDPIVAVLALFHRDVPRAESLAVAAAHGATVRSTLQSVNGLVLEMPHADINALADEDAVQWLEPPLPALTELNAENREVTQANLAQAPPYNLDGTGVVVMVFDGGIALASHTDFGGRLTPRDSSNLSNHATHVSGTIGGDGAQSDGLYRGMAPNVTIESYGFQWAGGGIFLYTNPGDIEQDYGEAINAYGATIANNSIGTNVSINGFPCSITGEYGFTDTIIDAIVRGSLGDNIRIVWANGNERQSSTCGNLYHTTAPPACAKNHFTVGALNSDDNSVTSFTSWGPCNDGRLKPDISAPGCKIGPGNSVVSCSSSGGYTGMCGTSMASPTVAGLAALLLQDYRVRFPDEPDLLQSTMKALFIHTALDIENPGPDYKTGYGLAQVKDAVDFMRQANFHEGVIEHGQTLSYTINVTEPGPLKATLVWDDPPGTPNTNPALVNDLDLLVSGPGGTFFPWTLDPESPAAPAVRAGPDRVNNVEQVLVDAALPGLWTVHVIGYNVPEGPQTFSLAAGPALVRTTISFPDGVPTIIAPGAPHTFAVRIVGVNEVVVPGSPHVHYRIGSTALGTGIPGPESRGAFTSVPLISTGEDLYEATLPPLSCGWEIEFYISAEGTIGGYVAHPFDAPDAVHEPEVGELLLVFADDLDDDLGWVVGAADDDAIAGIWERVWPVGTTVGAQQVQPNAPFIGTACYVTGQHPGGGAGANDVDHGKTTLFSPTFDLTALGSGIRAEVTYVRWYTNSAGANPNNDIFTVDVSNDGGQTWTNAETVGPAGPGTAGGWFHSGFVLGGEDGVTSLSSQVSVRFVASDYDPQALVEAAVDRFRLRLVVCDDPPTGCPADLNGDGAVDAVDLLMLLDAWGPAPGQPPHPADLNDDGVVDVSDLLILLDAWGPCS